MLANIGGYSDIVILVVATYGLACRRDPLSWLLVGWIVLTMAKTFGIQPLFAWWNVVPGVAQTAFYRYAPPTWELAFIVLSAFGIDALDIRAVRSSGPVLSAVAALVVGTGFLLTYGAKLWPQIGSVPGLNAWALISVDWSSTAAMAATLLLANNRRRWKVYVISGILMFESSFLVHNPYAKQCKGWPSRSTGDCVLAEKYGVTALLYLRSDPAQLWRLFSDRIY